MSLLILFAGSGLQGPWAPPTYPTPDNRRLDIGEEDRRYELRNEDRRLDIDQESRRYEIEDYS